MEEIQRSTEEYPVKNITVKRNRALMRENTWAVEGFFHICKRRERLGMFVTMEKDSEESGK